MVFAPWPDHLLSLDEWDELDLDPAQRYELVEGVITVMSRPTVLHQHAVKRLGTLLDAWLPADLTALPEVEVVTGTRVPASVRVPDLVVTSSALARTDPARLSSADVLLVVEILSPGTRRTDRITKLAEYADAGIPAYWIVDVEPPVSLTAHLLVDGDYEITAQGSGRLKVLTPVEVQVDLDRLLP